MVPYAGISSVTTLGNECGKTLPFYLYSFLTNDMLMLDVSAQLSYFFVIMINNNSKRLIIAKVAMVLIFYFVVI